MSSCLFIILLSLLIFHCLILLVLLLFYLYTNHSCFFGNSPFAVRSNDRPAIIKTATFNYKKNVHLPNTTKDYRCVQHVFPTPNFGHILSHFYCMNIVKWKTGKSRKKMSPDNHYSATVVVGSASVYGYPTKTVSGSARTFFWSMEPGIPVKSRSKWSQLMWHLLTNVNSQACGMVTP